MKLLVVTPYFYPKIGGLENYAYNFCRGLKDKYKWDVVVITSNHEQRENKTEVINGLKIYRLSPLFKISNTPVNPFWFYEISKIIKKEKPDIINAHTPVPFIAEVAALTAKNIPFVLTYHSLSIYKHGFNLFNSIVWSYKLIENYLFKKASKIIVVSKCLKEKFPPYLKEKIVVINNSISEKDVPDLVQDNKKDNIVIFTGSLDKTHNWKGLDLLLDSIKKIADNYTKNIKLMVIGDGNWKENYLNQVKKLNIGKYVSFVGLKTGKEKHSYFKMAKLAVIYPKTSNDALPTFLLEAWAYSVPVIGSDIQPISKIISNNSDGLLVPANSSSDLAKYIYLLLSNKDLRQELSKNGHIKLKKSYILENQLVQYNKLLINHKL